MKGRRFIFAALSALLFAALAVRCADAYTLDIPPEESKAFRFVPTSGRDYAVTLLGRRIYLLTIRGKELRNPAIPEMKGTLSGGVAVIRCPDFAGSKATLTFVNGILTRIVRHNGTDERKAKDEKVVRLEPSGKFPLLRMWNPKEDTKAKQWEYWTYWDKQNRLDRLRLWFFNPNGTGTFFAELALLAFAAIVFLKRRSLRIAGGILFAAFVWCELKTGSRGAFISLLVSAALLALFSFRRSFSKKKVFVFCGTVAAVVVLAGVGAFGTRMGKNLFAMTWSNVARLQIWREFPRMLAAAPDGWGLNISGAVFCDWFQPLKVYDSFVWLVNSHLTWIVELGCWFCAAYVFLWLTVFFISFHAAWRGSKSAMIVAGLALLMFISAWFSTIGMFVSLWVLPAAAFVCLIIYLIRNFNRVDACLLVAAFLFAAIMPYAIILVGRNMSPAPESVKHIAHEDGITVIGKGKPSVYLVTDKDVLSIGGGMGRDLRRYLAEYPQAKAIAITDSVLKLPKQMDRLVLTGKTCAAYLRLRQEHLADDAYPHAKKIVMLSPPFPPALIPTTLADGGTLTVVYGNFARRLDSKIDVNTPKWVNFAANAELYIPNWPYYLGEKR